MRYGFVSDQDRCIGCHACTVACKEENQVPVGVFRTWVKYVEKGAFPDTRRHFGVLRCNHCDDAPCVEICPTRALYTRKDGIVDFDGNRCIGCKSCMQACPYDALYIDPNTDTAAKCNYCAHRVEVNLEPACVIVCPTRAIIPGDLDDPTTLISRIVTNDKVTVRKPQKGTEPKLFYKGVEGDLLQPPRMQQRGTYFWSDRVESDQQIIAEGHAVGNTREIYDVPHTMPWGWKISTYLWTKSIAAGALFLPAFMLGYIPYSRLLTVVMPAIALAALAATLLLLVTDLKRPDRFFYLLTKPNFRSWLVLGSYILLGYGLMAALWLAEGLYGHNLVIFQGRGFFVGATVAPAVRWIAVAFGIGSACYSAFLFAQAKGRDLWQSQMFFWHLLVHAVICGAAVLMLASALQRTDRGVVLFASLVLAGAVALSLAMILAEINLPHVSEDVRIATQELTTGRFSGRFWGLAIGLGALAPLVLIALVWGRVLGPGAVMLAAALALLGVWWFEDLWVQAGQVVPLS